MPRLTAAKKQELQKGFNQYDKSGDGKLSFTEMKVLLQKGNPSMGDEELKNLYKGVDKNNDGCVDFEEFIAYLYTEEPKDIPPAPKDVENSFQAFAGQGGTLDSKEFMKVCKDCKLIDKKFTVQDVDTVFAKIKPKGGRNIGFQDFAKALNEVASKKGCSLERVYDIVALGSPQMTATKADYVAMHDDKSKYTGTHATDGRHGGAGNQTVRAHDQQGPDHSSDTTDWSACSDAFNQYAGKSKEIDTTEFKKLCQDAGVIDRNFTGNDCDIVFAKVVPKGERQIVFDEFKEACRIIADKRGVAYKDIADMVARCSDGPKLQGTQAEYNRFHDDKSMYTGTHAGKP